MSETDRELALNDLLALERTKMANERTYLAYVRTSLYFLLGGFAFINLKGFESNVVFGYIAIGISLMLIVTGTTKFIMVRRRIKNRQSPK